MLFIFGNPSRMGAEPAELWQAPGEDMERVLADFELAVNHWGLRGLAVKDDTFTVNRQRALAICHGIVERNLNFLWSCDSRIDTLDDELLRAMRQAGCQRISVGVESGLRPAGLWRLSIIFLGCR